MSWQAMGAVQAASSFVDPQKSVGFRILLAIAGLLRRQRGMELEHEREVEQKKEQTDGA